MGFKRIEWIFFIAFLGVNIFLLNIYMGSKNDQSIVSTKSQKVPIEQRLANDDIQYKGTLSAENFMGYYLSGIPMNMTEMLNKSISQKNVILDDGTTKVDGSRLTHIINDHFLVSEKDSFNKIISSYLDRNVIDGNLYTYQENLSTISTNHSEIIATQSYEGIPLNDVSGEITFSFSKQNDSYVSDSYTQSFVEDLKPLREKMALHSEKDAINALYINNRIANKSTIGWIQLSYTLVLNVRGQNVYVPAWFVSIDKPDKTHQIEIVNAFSNRIITNASVRIVDKT